MAKLESVAVTLEIVDGRVAMNAEGKADCYVETPDHTPLTSGERHATLRIVDDGYRAEIELDADDVETLADSLAGTLERES